MWQSSSGVAGIGDLSVARLVSPSLTTVRIPRPQPDGAAAQFLLDVLPGHGPEDGSHTTLPSDLVIGQSPQKHLRVDDRTEGANRRRHAVTLGPPATPPRRTCHAG